MPQRFVALVVLFAGFAASLNFLATAADPKANQMTPKMAALAGQLKSPMDIDRMKAIQEISNLGKQGAPLARPLCDHIVDPNAGKTSTLAVIALNKVRPDLGQSVMKIRLTKDKDLAKHAEAVQEVGSLGKEGAPAVPIILAVIKETAASTLSAASKQLVLQKEIEALAAVGADDPTAISNLVTFAGGTTREPALRGNALMSLATLAASNESLRKRVVPVVKTALDAAPVRLAALEAAIRLGTAGADLAPALTKLTTDSDESNRKLATEALAAVEGKPTTATDADALPPQVKAALAWIVKNQKPDGCCAGGKVPNPYEAVVITSVSGLALMASGGPYQVPIDRAAEYVLKAMFVTGKDVKIPPELDQSNWSIGIGGLFLAEYYAAKKKDTNFDAATAQAILEKIALEAIKRMEASGGWGHTPRVKNPLGYVELQIVGNWMLAMLGASQRLGVKLPDDKLKQALQFTRDCSKAGKGDIGYSPRAGQKGMVCPGRTGGALFAFGLLGLDKDAHYPLMANAWRFSRDRTTEGHGSAAMGYLGSALGARQLGNEEWRAYKGGFFPKILDAANMDGSFKHLTGTTIVSRGFDGTLGPAYNTPFYALILQLDRGNLKFVGQKHGG